MINLDPGKIIPSFSVYARDIKVLDAAKALVFYYYIVLVYLAVEAFSGLSGQIYAQGYTPLWPLGWAELIGLNQFYTLNSVRIFFILAVFLGVFLYKKAWGRVVVFLGIWQFHAAMSSFYHPSHQWYPWLSTSFILIFLPNIWTNGNQENIKKFLLIIWTAQFIILLPYTLSGIWKFTALLTQLTAGEINGFSKEAFAYQIADWLPRLDYKPDFADLILNNPIFGWPFYILSYFLELFSIWAAFKLPLQKIWGVMLILFHLGTIAFMGIFFMPSIMILAIFFLASPFCVSKKR
jgi:hypothetical protein